MLIKGGRSDAFAVLLAIEDELKVGGALSPEYVLDDDSSLAYASDVNGREDIGVAFHCDIAASTDIDDAVELDSVSSPSVAWLLEKCTLRGGLGFLAIGERHDCKDCGEGCEMTI